MKISIQVKTKAKADKVEALDESSPLKNYVVWVKALPQENKANEAVEKTLAKHFGIAKSKVKIISGLKSKRKIVSVAQ